jgi:hypothetical protein
VSVATFDVVDIPSLAPELSEDEVATLARLKAKLRQDTNGRPGMRRQPSKLGFRQLQAYFDGEQELEQLGLAVPPELRSFVTIANWCRVIVKAYAERLRLEGFRLPKQADGDQDLWRIWQANGLDKGSQMAHEAALIFGRSFICIGAGDEDGTPLVTVESPLEMTAERSPRTRQLTAVARFYDDDSDGDIVKRATLYTGQATTWLVGGKTGWEIEERDEHRLGVPPVVALVHDEQLTKPWGRSLLLDAIKLVDAAARALTNAQVATEVMAIPQRYIAGMKKNDFVDEQGNMLPLFESYFSAILMSENEGAKFGQFAAADLGNFTKIVDEYGQLIAGTYGLPLRYLGQLTTNPPSADGIRADEQRLVGGAEWMQVAFGETWESAGRIIHRFVDGDWNRELLQMESIWRDAATPTRAQAADAALKLYAGAKPIIPLRQVREDLRYSEIQIQRMEEMDRKAAEDPQIQAILANLRQPAPASDAQATADAQAAAASATGAAPAAPEPAAAAPA